MISPTPSPTLVCIDTTVESYEYLCQGVLLGSEVILLDSNCDGVEQITELLRKRISQQTAPLIQTLHIVSHGSPGCLYLGNAQLNLYTLDHYKEQLHQWNEVLSEDSEILLYGCEVAQGENQQPFLQEIKRLTGAKIAASSTKIGSEKLGGNWHLDVQTDKMLSPLAFAGSVRRNYAGVLAPFLVTNTNDSGEGSLRNALELANANAEADEINFDPNVFNTPQTILLTSGRLNIDDNNGNNLTINGPGADLLTIQGQGEQGDAFIFQVNADQPETVVKISGVTVQNARTAIQYGGGLGTLEIDSSRIANNVQFGIVSRGRLVLTNSIIQDNITRGVSLSASNSIIQGNTFIATDPNQQRNGIFVFTQNNNENAPITSNVQIVGNFIGSNGNGTLGLGHRDQGIEIARAAGTQIIGNLISGNGAEGVLITEGSTNTIVRGNRIGVTPDGGASLGNVNGGITVRNSSGTVIGGGNPDDRNVISGNGRSGIVLETTEPTLPTANTVILGNHIGVDFAGNAPIPNGDQGILIDASSLNIIGGVNPGEGNVISGNAGDGISIQNGSAENRILGNLIGVNAAGDTAVPNVNHGVRIEGSGNNDIGLDRVENPDAAGTGRNVISGNGLNGLLVVNGSNENKILGNLIGTNAAGNGAVPNGTPEANNGGIGIEIRESSGNIIGRNLPGEQNTISGNLRDGILILGGGELGATANSVQGNFIGLDAAGVGAIPNQINGIILGGATNNIIGGTDPGQGNIISGNASNGLVLIDAANGNQVLGNFIGTNGTGNAGVPNGNSGLEINNAAGNGVFGNVISGNTVNGISLINGSGGNPIQNNIIGLSADRATPVGNLNAGIFLNAAANNAIGGLEPGQGNTIAFNGGDGVAVLGEGSVNNGILGNNIFFNGPENQAAIGIDLADDGVSVNDPLDPDIGPNNLQNYPQLVLAESVNNSTAVAGTLNGLANTAYRLEFFSNGAADPSGNGQGQTFIGTAEVTTDANGNGAFVATFPDTGDLSGQLITATATDPSNNTSEFSNVAEVRIPEIVIQPAENNQNEGDAGVVGYTYTVSLNRPTTQNIVVNYSTNDGTATLADGDYVDNDGTLTLAANPFAETPPSQGITVAVNGDITFEGDEGFNVSLDGATHGNIVTPSATGTIVNDDLPPSVSVGDVTVNEGQGTATFTVTASKISGFAATFDYATRNGTGGAGLDYAAAAGSLTIPVGQTTVSFEVPLIDDGLEEPDKNFAVDLTNLQGIDTANSRLTATANILDDDLSPVLSLDADGSSGAAPGNYQTNFAQGGAPSAIADSDVTIADGDSANLTGATVTLAQPFNPTTETLSVAGSLPANITAADFNPLSGQLVLTGTGSLADYQTALSQIVYNNTSAAPGNLARPIEISVSDGVNPSNTAVSTVNLIPVNTPPVANDDDALTRTDTPITFNILSNDFDRDGSIDPSTTPQLDLSGLNGQGTATVDPQGNLTFAPAAGFNGSVTLPYTVRDDGGETATAEVTISVNPAANLPPVAQNAIADIIPNTAVQVPVPALAAEDLDGTVAGFEIARLPEGGEVQLNGEAVAAGQILSPEEAASLTFTPKPGFVGVAEIVYTAFDNAGTSDLSPARVVMTVASPNQLPVAADRIAAPNSADGTPAPIPALAGSDADGPIAGYRITRFPANSTLLLNGQPLTTPEIAAADAPNLTYVGGGNFAGDRFQYTAIDAQGTEDPTPATVILPAATPENLPPSTADQFAPAIPNVPSPVALPPLGGTDADGNIASFTVTQLPFGGDLFLGETPVGTNQVIPADQADQLTFTPYPQFVGLTQFTYAATDNQGATDATPATYSLLVNPTNLPPLPLNTAVPLLKNVAVQVPLPPLSAAGGEDVVSFTVGLLPVGGQVFLNGEPLVSEQVIPADQAGQLTYTSNLDFSGSSSLKFTATNAAGIASQQVGELSLFTLPNLVPTAQPLPLVTIVPTGVPLALPTLTGTDEDGTVVSFAFNNIPDPNQGRLFLGDRPVSTLDQVAEITPAQASNLRFEPSENFVGDVVLNYVARDNDGQTSPESAPLPIRVLLQTPNVDFEIPPSEPVAEEFIVPNIPNNGTPVPIPPLTANDLNGEIVSFSILELPGETQGQLFLNGVLVTRLSQVTEITIAQASQLTFLPIATFSGEVQLRYSAKNSVGVTSSPTRIILQVPNISGEISTLPTDLPAEILAFTATLAGLSQSYTFIRESIRLNSVEISLEGTASGEQILGVELAEQIVSGDGDDDVNSGGGDDNVFGNQGNDTLSSGDGNDVVDGDVGDDFILGSIGNDTLIGGSDNDSLTGGSDDPEFPDEDGQDVLDGGEGNDTLSGNQGEDTLIGGEGNDLVFGGKDDDLASGEEGNDTIFGDVGNDSIVGGDGNDFLLGNQGDDTISGGEGNDSIAGGQDNDLLFGDGGNDEVYGDLGEDTIYGNQGNDSLYGGDDNDTLIGGDGDDFLSGGDGEDVLSGGEGADIFALLLNSGSDVIVDFADGQDFLGLSAGLTFDELTIEPTETGTLIRFEGQTLASLSRVNLSALGEEDFTTVI